MEMTDDQLSAELTRRKGMLERKRKSDEVLAAASEKRIRMIAELQSINYELNADESCATSSAVSTSSSSSSSSYQVQIPVLPLPVPEQQVPLILPPPSPAPQAPKNSMFAYWAVKDNSAIDVEALNLQRTDDAKANSESRQSDLHRERRIAIGSQNKPKMTAALRTCSPSGWNAVHKKLKDDNLILITYSIAEKRIWCSACPCYVRDDNVEDHIATTKHLKASKLAIEENLHQTNLISAITISSTLSKCIPGKTHLFRCELVRTMLTAAMPISKADDWRPFLEKWAKVESTDSSNLLREYLPIIKVSLSNMTINYLKSS